MNKNVQDLINALSNLSNIEAICLGGSQALGTTDENSDYDIYIYSYEPIPKAERLKILNKYFKYIEFSNTYWEEEDDGVLFNDTPVEIIYRDIKSIDDSLNNLLINYNCNVGYSTCIWSSIINCKILYDKHGILTNLQNKYTIPYPQKLKENIIMTNFNLLKGKMPSYYYQIEKAIKRADLISVNHRVAAFLASYFDIIFAYNEFLHPGEKKLLKLIKDNNLVVPDDMENSILNILKLSGTIDNQLLTELDLLIINLKDKYSI